MDPVTPVNPATAAKYRWLAKCRADPAKKQHMKELRRKYYEKNLEEERASALARYYRRKAERAAAAPPPEAPAPPAYPPGVPLV